MNLKKYDSLLKATKDLAKRGFKNKLELKKEKVVDLLSQKTYCPSEMNIVEYHRFEGKRRLGSKSIIFVVECADKVKGVVVSFYNTYADMDLLKFMDKVKIKKRIPTTT